MSRPNIAFPRVWKRGRSRSMFSRFQEHDAAVAIVYWHRAEYYYENKERSIYRGQPGQPFNPFDEEEMLRGSGFKRVHYLEDKRTDDEIDDGIDPEEMGQ